MTTPRKPLSEAQLRQRREASLKGAQASAAKRRTQGLSEKELQQRRANAWKQGIEKRKRENEREKEVSRQFVQLATEQGIAPRLPDNLIDRNIRRLERLGISTNAIAEAGLERSPWHGKLMQSYLRKYDNLRRRGLTGVQATENLYLRARKTQNRDNLSNRVSLAVALAREHYSPEQRRAHRRSSLSPRQQEMKRLADARYRRTHRSDIRRRENERRAEARRQRIAGL